MVEKITLGPKLQYFCEEDDTIRMYFMQEEGCEVPVNPLTPI